MSKFNIIRDPSGAITHIETALTGSHLLSTSQLNKGCAFTPAERRLFCLDGLLPHRVESFEEQVARMYAQYSEHTTDLAKNIYLNVLHDYNETLFYRLVSNHLEEMLPIIYTPTVGQAVENFSLELRKPRGLYISYEDRDQLETIITRQLPRHTQLLVVTDGEGVLGLGDQGIGGIKICNAKLMVYALCAGLDPSRSFPIQLDMDTNNPKLLADPLYLGWRHERVNGQAYDDFIEHFVKVIKKHLPTVYLHWEDFGRDNARRILTRYREEMCTLNGDIQSTGCVTLAAVLAACQASGARLTEQRVVIFGAGTAGVGVADQIVTAMQRSGISAKEAYDRFWLIDKMGLLIEDQTTLLPFQRPFTRKRTEIMNWNAAQLADVITHVKPTILIGSSALTGAFTETIVKQMAQHTKRPIILPLSNPTSKSEAVPQDLSNWTEGRALIATGSPFPEVDFAGTKLRIAQSNNALTFPGIGLGVIAAQASRLTDDMLWAATKALSDCSPVTENAHAPLLPKLSETLTVSHKIALAVIASAREEGLARIPDTLSANDAIRKVSWQPLYYPYVKVD